MSGIAIYLEGGGEGANSRAALRYGMDDFLKELKSACRLRRWRWKTIACGGRKQAFDHFKNATDDRDFPFAVLLVDAEEPLNGGRKNHLILRDSWDLEEFEESRIHLMVQVMETWLAADPDGLATFYGRDFQRNALPRAQNLELTSKKEIFEALKIATRRTSKGSYHKIKHIADTLGRINSTVVRQRCPNCESLFIAITRMLR
jgi:hypothetical protein